MQSVINITEILVCILHEKTGGQDIEFRSFFRWLKNIALALNLYFYVKTYIIPYFIIIKIMM